MLELKRADTLAQSCYQRQEKLDQIDKVEELYEQILQKKECVSLKTLQITGNDLIALGVPKGKEIGRILNSLLEEVLIDPQNNTPEYLIQKAKKMMV